MSYFIDDSLNQVKFSFQRRVQQQSQRVKFHSHAVINAFRAGLTQVGPLSLRRQSPSWVKMILKQLSKYIIVIGLKTAQSHGEACPAEVEASTLFGVQPRLRTEEWLVFRFLVP